MLHFLTWYLTITLLGWLTFPLVYRLFPALADRGYSLARTAGLLIWGYVFWMFTSLGLSQNDTGGILLAALILAGLSTWALFARGRKTDESGQNTVNGPSSIVAWLKANWRLVITVEALFLVAFGMVAIYRAANPELYSAEKPMELAFIDAILRSPTFPPHDPWLSGYAISYYYFGYVMTAMLARLTGIPGSMAHNLMTALIFGLSAVGAYGILYNLLAVAKRHKSQVTRSLAFLGPLFLLLVTNFEGFLEVLHKRGLFWTFHADGTATSAFWQWLDIKELNVPPMQPLGWIPDRYWWWWRASRVIQDRDLLGNSIEIIDEFPFFSFLHADLHPHVLALPFSLMVMAVALHFFLGGWGGKIDLLGWRLHISPEGFAFTSLLLGGIAFLNTWDILIAAVLLAGAYVLARVRAAGWNMDRLGDFVFFGLSFGIMAFVLYLPFYFGFASQAGGPLPDLVNPTRGAHLWVMFGPLLLPLAGYLFYLLLNRRRPTAWPTALGVTLGLVAVLWSASWLLGILIINYKPQVAGMFLQMQGVADFRSLFVQATNRRLSSIGGLLTQVSVLGLALALLIPSAREDLSETETDLGEEENEPGPRAFILLLVVLGAVLVLVPDFIYLRDQFGTRLNTVFKFYYQTWQMWSLAAAFGLAMLLINLRWFWNVVTRVGLAVLLFVTLTYPVLGVLNKTNNFNPLTGWTLDGASSTIQWNPDEAAAIEWLRSAPYGVVAEAVGGQYTQYARISTYTGLPTVLGWPGHELQWRGSAEEQGSRQFDIETLYSSPDWATTQAIIERYHIRYIYVGSLERSTYRVREDKFIRMLTPVFTQGAVTIYETP
jgi:YYY domain-containing protein